MGLAGGQKPQGQGEAGAVGGGGLQDRQECVRRGSQREGERPYREGHPPEQAGHAPRIPPTPAHSPEHLGVTPRV